MEVLILKRNIYTKWIIARVTLFRRRFLNTLRPRQNGRHFADDLFKLILMNKDMWISIDTSLMFLPTGQINNIPLSESVMFSLPAQILRHSASMS